MTVSFWGAVFCVVLYAELNNSTNMMMTAGLGFAANQLAAFMAIIVVVGTPMVTLKFLNAILGEQGKKVLDFTICVIAIPTSIALIVMFSQTIGGSHEEIGLFSDSASEGHSFWVLYMFSMFGLALTIIMVQKFLKRTCEHFLVFSSIANPVYVAIMNRVEVLDDAIAGITADCAEMKRVISGLDSECGEFADANSDALNRLKRRFNRNQDEFLSNELLN